MNNDIKFLKQSYFPDDTTKKAKAVTATDTAKKELQVVAPQDTSKQKNTSDTSKPQPQVVAPVQPKPEPVTPQPVATPVAQAETAVVQEETPVVSEVDTSNVVPMFSPTWQADTTLYYCDLQLFDIDSLIATHDTVFYHRSVFSGHSLQVQSDTHAAQRPHTMAPFWVFVLIILVAVFLGKVVADYKGHKSDLLLSPFRRLSWKSLISERTTINKPSVNLFIGFLYSLLMSLAEFYVIRHFGQTFTGNAVFDYLILEGFTFLFIYIRVLLVKFIGRVFNYQISTGAYVLNQSICNLLCGILLVPALLVAFYSSLDSMVLLYVLTAIIVVMFLIRVVRGSLLMLSESQFSKIYMLYYMFVIEIVPILVIGKWITLQM